MEGWLFEVYPDHDISRMVLWVLSGDGGRARGYRHVFWPTMYVSGRTDDLRKLEDMFSQLSSVRRARILTRQVDITDRRPREVLELEFGRYSELQRTARTIDRIGGFHDMALFNVDLRLPARFMVEHGIFPLARIRLDPSTGELGSLDDQFAIEYDLPDLMKVHMQLDVDAAKGIPTLKDRLRAVRLTVCDGVDEDGGPLVHGEEGPREQETWTIDGGKGGEESVLRQLLSAVSRLDPDVIFTANGDSFELPFLYFRADNAGIGDKFRLGREDPPPGSTDGQPQAPRAQKRARSYFSYGRIEYKPAAHLLRGRWHIDGSSFHIRESGLDGLIDLSRISCIPVQEMSRLSPGTAISTMQVLEALRSGYLVAWKKNIPERFKSARNLLAADRGGLILAPRVGVHDNVAEMDFASLYPNIMVKYNISPETIFCDCCEPEPMTVVPEAGYHFCRKRVGLVPKVLKPVIDRRFEYKRKSKDPSIPEHGRRSAKEMNDILKWLLVVCFGYTGYKNARFGRIECHESITSYAREIMIHAQNVSEAFGFEVLHGIVDSLWVKGKGDVDKLCEAISGSIGIPILLEGHYKWIVFLPNKTNGVGALNRYYGVFKDGETKVRGIEARRQDTPNYFRRVQGDMMAELAKGDDAAGFMEHIPDALEVMRGHAKEILSGDIPLRELTFVHRVSQPLEDYRVFSNQVSALKKLKAKGFTVNPGQKVKYVITNSRCMDWRERVEVAEFATHDTRYDREKYYEFLCRCGESMLLPFGYTLERLMRKLKSKSN